MSLTTITSPLLIFAKLLLTEYIQQCLLDRIQTVWMSGVLGNWKLDRAYMFLKYHTVCLSHTYIRKYLSTN